MRLNAQDIKDLNLMKHYRIIRKWACKNNDLTDSDLELLIYLDCIDLFTIKDFKAGTYTYSWNNRRWNKLIQNNWVVVWRNSCLLYTSPSPRDRTRSRMPSSA